jgi:acetyl esterase/lipase
MSIDPQARAYLDRVAASGIPPAHLLAPEEARRNFVAGTALVAGDALPLARVEELSLPGPAGRVPARLYAAAASAGLPVTLYFHGGGWVLGDLETHDALCRRLAAASRSIVLSIDYRLAPDNVYPAAADDCWAALTWTAAHAADIGGDASRLAVAGDSAGGNLAAVVALRARDEGLPLRLQVLVYPVTDHDLETPSYLANAEGYGLLRDSMRWYWDSYCPDPAQRGEPGASPLRAPDLSGLAPAFVIVCELDPLHDEGVAYARRLEAAGVPVRLRREPGMIHGFVRMLGVIDRAHDAVGEIGGALEAAFSKGMAEAAR